MLNVLLGFGCKSYIYEVVIRLFKNNPLYDEDLNNKLVQYSDHRHVFDPGMVRYTSHDLKNRQLTNQKVDIFVG